MKKLILLVLTLILLSCGTNKKVTIASVSDNMIFTTEEQTILTKKRIAYYLVPGETYILIMKDGKCVNVKRKIKSK